MFKRISLCLFSLLLATPAFAASTSFQATLGSGAGFAAWCVGGTGATCSGGAFWPATVIANSAGTELFTSGNAAYVQFPSAQAVNATLQASATTAIGKVDPNTPASWGIGATGSAVPANATYLGMLVGGNLTGIPGTAYGASVDESTSSQLHTDLAAPPNQAYSATWGALSYSSGNNPAGGDAKGAWWQDIGAINGVALLAGAGATGTGSPRATVAQDTTTVAGSAPGTAGTPSANVVSVQGESSMTPVLVTPSAPADPCFSSSKTNLAINQNGTSSVQLIALSGSTTIYVCSLSLIAAGATTVAITAGTGTACATPTAAVIGSTAANIANSISLAANGGLTLGSGVGTIAKGVASSELCMILGTSVYVSGNLTYVQQ